MFNFGENSYLGVDIGTSTIKVAEIKLKEGRPVLSNYAWMKMPVTQGDISAASFEALLPEYLKKILKEGSFSEKNIFLSIQSFGALITLIDFPLMSKDELEQAIKFEAHKYIPVSLDEVSLSWGVIGSENIQLVKEESEKKKQMGKGYVSEGGKKIQILMVAAPKNIIAKYERIAKKAGISPTAIEIESFSIVRSLIGRDAGSFVIVDIGSRVCNIMLVEKGELKVSRNIDAGGKDLTNAIAKGLSIDEERAEKLKLSNNDFFGKESSIVFSSLNLIIGEIKRMITSYYDKNNHNNEEKINGIVLSGGTASLTGIEKFFSEALSANVTVGNPFGRIEYNKRLEQKIKEIGPQFSVAVGLALKGLDN